jgi:hypothetical protein
LFGTFAFQITKRVFCFHSFFDRQSLSLIMFFTFFTGQGMGKVLGHQWSQNRTLNSYSLCLLVVFHFQGMFAFTSLQLFSIFAKYISSYIPQVSTSTTQRSCLKIKIRLLILTQGVCVA